MLVPTIFLLGLGLVAAVGLAIASKVFYVWEDPKIGEVEDSLLGANCGGCGYAGCSAAAAAVVSGDAAADICVAGGPEISMQIASVMGVKIEIKEPEIASSSCRYSVEQADVKYNYSGVNDCKAAMLYAGGIKECPIGCLGLGTCVRACPFGALAMGDNGLPVIDSIKCRACGVCVETCPKHIIKLTSTSNRMISDYTYDECTSPCQRTCPTGIDIPGYIRFISMGNYKEAIRIIKEKNPLPLICGRICPAPCEIECRRKLADEPVAINYLKRFVADYEMNNGANIHPYLAPKTDNKIAVIGGGAQGLTSAYYLACLGHLPTIYESTTKLGGIIRNVIVKTRLPDNIIDWEIENILNVGVKAELNTTLGSDVTISSLLEDGYKAVLLASGGQDSRNILRGHIDLDQTIPGVYMLLDFIMSSNKKVPEIGKNVFIVGGGNSSIKAAGICKNNGADSVTVLYPYTRDDLLSRKIDVKKAENDGIKFVFSTVINKLIGEANKLTQIILESNEEIKEEKADTIIVSTGRLSDIIFVREKIDSNENGKEPLYTKRWHTLESYKMFPENTNNDIFNLNNKVIINDNMAVVKAINRGRKNSRSVHYYLNEKELTLQDNIITSDMNILNVDNLVNVNKCSREIMRQCAGDMKYTEIQKMYGKEEINLGFTEQMAINESNRCLDCGLVCYKKS